MKTIELSCVECGAQFTVARSQYTYQNNKKPDRDWFCSRSCGTTHANKHKRSDRYKEQRSQRLLEMQHEASIKGTATRQKYNQEFTWYIKRLTYDYRFGGMQTSEWRMIIAAELERTWLQQRGLCALTHLGLTLRTSRGCTEANPFLIASVDRIDCNLPYQEGNIQWVSCAMNLARNNTPLHEFREHLKVFQSV